MPKKIKIAFAFPVVAACVLLIWAFSPSVGGVGDSIIPSRKASEAPPIQVTCEIPLSFPEMQELVIEKIQLDDQAVRQVARAPPFNMLGELQSFQAHWGAVFPEYKALWGDNIEFGVYVGAGKETTELSLFENGAIMYTTPEWRGDLPFPPLPSEDEARRIADDFLADLQNSGAFFPADEQQLIFSKVAEGSVSYMGSGRQLNYWAVLYSIEYNGIPIAGCGAHIDVGIRGKVVALFADWRNIVPSGRTVNITITPQQAIENLRNVFPYSFGKSGSYAASIANVEVQGIRLVYYSADSLLRDLAPLSVMYEFSGIFTHFDGTQRPFAMRVSATD